MLNFWGRQLSKIEKKMCTLQIYLCDDILMWWLWHKLWRFADKKYDFDDAHKEGMLNMFYFAARYCFSMCLIGMIFYVSWSIDIIGSFSFPSYHPINTTKKYEKLPWRKWKVNIQWQKRKLKCVGKNQILFHFVFFCEGHKSRIDWSTA